METKRALKRESHLIKVLTQSRVTQEIARIIDAETSAPLVPSIFQKPVIKETSPEVSTATTLLMQRDSGCVLGKRKEFPRVVSAAQMVLLANEEEGPKENQIPKESNTEETTAIRNVGRKSDVFYVFNGEKVGGEEEEYKDKINYKDGCTNLLKKASSKHKEKRRENVYKKLPELEKAFHINVLKPTPPETKSTIHDSNITFSFSSYTPRILCSYFNQYVFSHLSKCLLYIIGILIATMNSNHTWIY